MMTAIILGSIISELSDLVKGRQYEMETETIRINALRSSLDSFNRTILLNETVPCPNNMNCIDVKIRDIVPHLRNQTFNAFMPNIPVGSYLRCWSYEARLFIKDWDAGSKGNWNIPYIEFTKNC